MYFKICFESSLSSSSALPSSTVSVSDSSIAMMLRIIIIFWNLAYSRDFFDGVHNVGALINLFIFGFPALACALEVLEPVLSPTEIGSQICQQDHNNLNAFKAGISPSSRIIVDELLDRYSLSLWIYNGQNHSMKANIPCLLVYQYIAKTPPQGDPN
ncbi:hypothetical protein OROMI_002196 [Orobanche minor]